MKLENVKVGMRVAYVNQSGETSLKCTVVEFRPLGLLKVKADDGREFSCFSRDLVRLVPKKRKPRELWVNTYDEKLCTCMHESRQGALDEIKQDAPLEGVKIKQIKFREVIE